MVARTQRPGWEERRRQQLCRPLAPVSCSPAPDPPASGSQQHSARLDLPRVPAATCSMDSDSGELSEGELVSPAGKRGCCRTDRCRSALRGTALGAPATRNGCPLSAASGAAPALGAEEGALPPRRLRDQPPRAVPAVQRAGRTAAPSSRPGGGASGNRLLRRLLGQNRPREAGGVRFSPRLRSAPSSRLPGGGQRAALESRSAMM